MHCSKILKLLWDFEAGKLSTDQAARVKQHLEGCRRCREAADQIHLLTSASRDLAETALEKDLWPGIQQRVLMPSEPSRERHRRPAPLSGWRPKLVWAFGLAGLLLILFIAQQQLRPTGPQTLSVPEQARGTEEARTDLQLARQHYEHSVQSLERIVAHRSPEIDLDQARLYQDKLQQLETVIAECSQALENNRYDVRAQQTLFNAYDQKISTLREMSVSASY